MHSLRSIPAAYSVFILHSNAIPFDLPFKMDIAINGKITKTMEREEWLSHTGTFGVELCDLRSFVFSFVPTYYVDKSCSSPNLSFSSFIRRNEQELRPFPPHGRHQLRRTRLGRGGRGWYRRGRHPLPSGERTTPGILSLSHLLCIIISLISSHMHKYYTFCFLFLPDVLSWHSALSTESSYMHTRN